MHMPAQVTWNAEAQQPVCQKLHTSVEIPEAVRLGGFLAAGALPPLAGSRACEPGKENEQQAANAAAAAAPGEGGFSSRPAKELAPRRGVQFYGTPVATGVVLSPLPGRQFHSSTPKTFLRRRSTPVAGPFARCGRAGGGAFVT